MKKWFIVLLVNFLIVMAIESLSYIDSDALMKAALARRAHHENPTQANAQCLKEANRRVLIEALCLRGVFLVVLVAGNVVVIWGVRRVSTMLRVKRGQTSLNS